MNGIGVNGRWTMNATTNAAAFYRITAGTETSGTYTSAALDAGQVARFGTFRWRGEVPEKGGLRVSFRSGVSAEPDHTWSAWTEPREGREIPLAGVPLGRYVQWRAELNGSERSSPRFYEVELSYRQENLRPKIALFAALEPGQVLVPANFNPSNQVFEPAHSARSGIFTTLTPGSEDEGGGRVKALWKLGYQTLRWTAMDPNCAVAVTAAIAVGVALREGRSPSRHPPTEKAQGPRAQMATATVKDN